MRRPFLTCRFCRRIFRQWSPAKFDILADFLIAEYGKKGVDIETLVLRQQEKARKRGREIDHDGTPKVLYHQTDGEFTVFDVGRYGAGTRDNETPFGVFLKSSEKEIGLRGVRSVITGTSAGYRR